MSRRLTALVIGNAAYEGSSKLKSPGNGADDLAAMLREQLRRRAGDALQAMWRRTPQDELTPEIEQEIVDEVRQVRAEQSGATRPIRASPSSPRVRWSTGSTREARPDPETVHYPSAVQGGMASRLR